MKKPPANLQVAIKSELSNKLFYPGVGKFAISKLVLALFPALIEQFL